MSICNEPQLCRTNHSRKHQEEEVKHKLIPVKSTSVMLLGLDLEDVDIIGMIRPFNHCHDLLQAAGRGRRKLGNLGKRRKVVFYVLFNQSDISNAVPGLTEEVKEFCETDGCLKMFLRRKFGFLHQNQTDSAWCCSNCS